MPKLTGSTVVSAALWLASLAWLFAGLATSRHETYRLLLAMAISSTVFAAIDHHRGQLAEIAALSYRAGVAAGRRTPSAGA